MDEVGRGTSTFDGLSLAWAAAHYIGERIGAFTLFATHYFELTALAAELPGCANVHLDATSHGDQLIFMHAVKEGPANQSYGLQVAALAGVPGTVISRARGYLDATGKGQPRRAPGSGAPGRARPAPGTGRGPAPRATRRDGPGPHVAARSAGCALPVEEAAVRIATARFGHG